LVRRWEARENPRVPLDPELANFVDPVNASGALGMDHSVDEIRTGYAALRFVFGEPEAMASVDDVVIDGPGGDLVLRVYRPSDAPDLPILVWFHGGGMVIGDLDTHDHLCRELANRVTCVIVSVDYRLAPEHPFPASLDDAQVALDWVAEHASEIGGDASRLAVGGDSAGGTIAAVMARSASERGRPSLRAQLLVYPVTDWGENPPWESRTSNAEGYLLTSALMDWFRERYLPTGETDDPRQSPISSPNFEGLAPAVVVTAEFDPLHDEGVAYHERLLEAGTTSRLLDYPGAIHLFFQLGPLTQIGRRAVDEAAAALRELLLASP
jgi:acetyl esterase